MQSTENVRLNGKLSYIFKSIRHSMKSIVQRQGIGALYVAFPLCMLRESVASFIYFFTFEFLKNSFKVRNQKNELAFYKIFICGGVAGMSNWLITLPIDNVKTKMISDTLNESRNYKTIPQLSFSKKLFFRNLNLYFQKAV